MRMSQSDSLDRPTKRRRISCDTRDYQESGINEMPKSLYPHIEQQQAHINPTAIQVPATPPPASFDGSFDLFNTAHFNGINLSGQQQESSVPNYHDLYTRLRSNPSGSTTKCYIPPEGGPNTKGILQSLNIRDPLSSDYVHLIYLDGITKTPARTNESPSVTATLQVCGNGFISDIIDSFGEFRMRRIWAQMSSDGSHLMELFEAKVSLNIFHGEEYEERGCAPAVDYQLEFLGLRQTGDERFGEKELNEAAVRCI
ncbi:hypothetical protein VNI00_000830 [Paramarasmius palmivorus]|uniref:Uncharacterized protein n=1 Tax=Paramarasmius palmivorus TaxID=297713 RepID=A0AAW0E9P6_9AGAR